MTTRRRFPRDAGEVANARRFVAGVLRQRHREVTDDVLLVTSELVTNAILHGQGDVELGVEVDGRGVRLTVVDEGTGPPSANPTMPHAAAVSGRGLALVEALSDTWGTTVDEAGHTVVWADVHLPCFAA